MAVGNPGKPRTIITSREQLEELCESYFEKCDEGKIVQQANRGKVVELKRAIPYTVPGLSYHLGYAYRQAVWELGQDPEYSDIIQRALQKIETQRQEAALLGEQNHHFAQFDLINNFKGYKSSKSEDVSVTLNVDLSDQELDKRLALLEGKVNHLEHKAVNVPVIEGDFQVKLLK